MVNINDVEFRPYRGKSVATDKWVYGFHYKAKSNIEKAHFSDYIAVPDTTKYAVNDEYMVWSYTLSPVIYRKDKNGKLIYKGDIVRVLYTDWPSKPDSDPRPLEEYLNDIAQIGVIVWSDEACGFAIKIGEGLYPVEPGRYGFIEVIGNIWDNPELIEEK